MYHFHLPKIVPFRFEDNIKDISTGAHDNLSDATDARQKVVGLVSKFTIESTDETLSALEQYLQKLQAMVDQSAEIGWLPPKCFRLQWGSSLGRNRLSTENKDLHCFTNLADELAQIYFLYALIHYMNGHYLVAGLTEYSEDESKSVTETRINSRKEAVRLLRVTAGILQALPIGPSVADERPLDSRKPTVDALAQMCLANAQVLTIQGAVEKGIKSILLAKLCIGVACRFKEIRTQLGKGLGGLYHSLHPTWNLYLKGMSEMYHALSRYYLAKDTVDGNRMDYGQTVALSASAQQLFSNIRIPNNGSQTLDVLRAEVAKHLFIVKEYAKVAKIDNEKIYFKPVPDTKDITIPDGMFMIKPLEFKSLEAVEKCFFMQAKSATEEKKVSEIQSDEELARSLQQDSNPHKTEKLTKMITFGSEKLGLKFEGNLLKKVTANSAAAKAGLVPGWTIMYVNHEKMPKNHKIIAKAIKKTQKSGQPTVIIFQADFQKLGTYWFKVNDFPQATFMFFQHQKHTLKGGECHDLNAASIRCKSPYTGLLEFLEKEYSNGNMKVTTTWAEVQKSWDNRNLQSVMKTSEDEASARSLTNSKLQSVKNSVSTEEVKSKMSEDEALARSLAGLNSKPHSDSVKSQINGDEALARSLSGQAPPFKAMDKVGASSSQPDPSIKAMDKVVVSSSQSAPSSFQPAPTSFQPMSQSPAGFSQPASSKAPPFKAMDKVGVSASQPGPSRFQPASSSFQPMSQSPAGFSQPAPSNICRKPQQNYPLRSFACAHCKNPFQVNCGPNTLVRCPISTCGAPNMIQ